MDCDVAIVGDGWDSNCEENSTNVLSYEDETAQNYIFLL